MFNRHLDLSPESVYNYFIDNQRTVGHQSVIFGVRELNSTELNQHCSNGSKNELPIPNGPFFFSSNYELRNYISGCYYLDSNQRWQSDGVLVRIYPSLWREEACLLLIIGWTIDQPLSNPMLVHASDHLCWWISCFTQPDQLELRFCQRWFPAQQDDLSDRDLRLCTLHPINDLCPLQG